MNGMSDKSASTGDLNDKLLATTRPQLRQVVKFFISEHPNQGRSPRTTSIPGF